MRLLYAVRGGGLEGPRDIVKAEGDLKREWKRKDKETMRGGSAGGGDAAAAAAAGAGAGTKTAGGNKRKRDGEEESVPTPKAATAKKDQGCGFDTCGEGGDWCWNRCEKRLLLSPLRKRASLNLCRR